VKSAVKPLGVLSAEKQKSRRRAQRLSVNPQLLSLTFLVLLS
jgi:hypothetical protein